MSPLIKTANDSIAPTFQRKTEWNLGTRLSPHVRESKVKGAIHSTKISGNFGPKLNGSVWSNRKSFEKTGPPFELDHFSRSDRLEFWLKGSRPWILDPHGDCAIQVLYSVRIHFSVDWLRFGIPILSGIWIISFGLYSRFQSSGFQVPQFVIRVEWKNFTVHFGQIEGAFHLTNTPIWNFGKSTWPMQRYIPVAHTRPKPPRVWLLLL